MPKKEKDKRTKRVVFYLTPTEYKQGEAKVKGSFIWRSVNSLAYASFLYHLDSK